MLAPFSSDAAAGLFGRLAPQDLGTEGLVEGSLLFLKLRQAMRDIASLLGAHPTSHPVWPPVLALAGAARALAAALASPDLPDRTMPDPALAGEFHALTSALVRALKETAHHLDRLPATGEPGEAAPRQPIARLLRGLVPTAWYACRNIALSWECRDQHITPDDREAIAALFRAVVRVTERAAWLDRLVAASDVPVILLHPPGRDFLCGPPFV